MGSIAAVWVGSSFAGMPALLHVAPVDGRGGACAGAFWAGIVGFLKATTGRQRGDLDDHAQLHGALHRALPVRPGRTAAERPRRVACRCRTTSSSGAKLPVFWGDPVLQGLHIGLFIALAALVVFWLLLNRSTIGYEVRAVGLNPEAARYGGMSVAKNYVLVMAVCGAFAGLAGSLDVLGWQFRLATNDIQTSLHRLLRHRRGAARPQHGRRHGGVGAPVRRADQRHLAAQPRPHDLRARAGHQPDLHHPGPRGADRERGRAGARLLAARARRRCGRGAAPRRRRGRRDGTPPQPPPPEADERAGRARASRASARLGWLGIALGALAWYIALPPLLLRTPLPSLVLALAAVAARRPGGRARRGAPAGLGAMVAGVLGGVGRGGRHALGRGQPRGASSSGRRCSPPCCASRRR